MKTINVKTSSNISRSPEKGLFISLGFFGSIINEFLRKMLAIICQNIVIPVFKHRMSFRNDRADWLISLFKLLAPINDILILKERPRVIFNDQLKIFPFQTRRRFLCLHSLYSITCNFDRDIVWRWCREPSNAMLHLDVQGTSNDILIKRFWQKQFSSSTTNIA